MSITKLALEIESLEKQLAEKRAEAMRLLGGPTVITLPKPRKPPSKVVKVSISERVRSELSKRPGGISFTDLCGLPSLSSENKSSVKSVLKKDRADGKAWFDGELYYLGEKPKTKKTPRPVKARGAGSTGDAVVAAPAG